MNKYICEFKGNDKADIVYLRLHFAIYLQKYNKK